MTRAWLVVRIGCLVLAVASGAAWAQRGEKPATSPGDAELKAAVATLVAEAEKYLDDPKAELPRSKSDFFAAGAAAIDEATLLEALGARQSRHRPVDAYVKWQLLSAIPGQFAEANVKRALQAYRRAPTPALVPGATPQERQQMDQLLQSIRQEDIAGVNEQWAARVAPVHRENDLVLRYRDHLFTRLPPSQPAFEAALADAYERVQAGIHPQRFMETVTAAIGSWSVNGASAAEMRSLAGTLAKLRDVAGPTVYTAVQWDGRAKRVTWKPLVPRVNPVYNANDPAQDRFATLATELQQTARNPSGGLKLRE